MVRALVHTVVENLWAFTTPGILPCSLTLALHCGSRDRLACWSSRSWNVVGPKYRESDTIIRTNGPMESSRPVWRPVILLARVDVHRFVHDLRLVQQRFHRPDSDERSKLVDLRNSTLTTS